MIHDWKVESVDPTILKFVKTELSKNRNSEQHWHISIDAI